MQLDDIVVIIIIIISVVVYFCFHIQYYILVFVYLLRTRPLKYNIKDPLPSFATVSSMASCDFDCRVGRRKNSRGNSVTHIGRHNTPKSGPIICDNDNYNNNNIL